MKDTVTWPVVVLALITGLPAILAAVLGLLNRKTLKTGNSKTLGEMVTEVHEQATDQGATHDTRGGAK